MKKFLALCFLVTVAADNHCNPINNPENPLEFMECVTIDDAGNVFPVNLADCEGPDQRCCIYTNPITQEMLCVVNVPDNSKPIVSPVNVMGQFFDESEETSKKSVNDNDAQMKQLPFPPIPGFKSPCIPPPIFPATCKPTRNEPYVLDPPVDVPYCLRIPCDPQNPALDKNIKACGSQPGCYFDQALFEYREAFGPSVLPGVPVCHLAIRNRFFRDKARTVIVKYGAWNPYFTNCLLREFHDEIIQGPKGCRLLPILDAFYVIPKLAGWSDITGSECAYIDGCWRPGFGCFYPVDINNVRVKSAQQKFFNKDEIVYGRPKCQVFDNSSPINILKSYHRCLSAGCTVDSSIRIHYYQHIFSLGCKFGPQDHWNYWDAVEKGVIGAHNIESSVGGYSQSPNSFATPPPAPTTTAPPPSDPFAAGLFGGGIFPSGGGGGIGGSGGSPSPSSKCDFSHPVSNCGFHFRSYGGRPCAPPNIPFSKPKKYCPYKPFFVPRFPKLKGSFKGCCDINLCYLPKAEISKMHSGPSVYYSEWSPFSECSVTCGRGIMKRYRKCISDNEKLCAESLEDVKACIRPSCGGWGRWSQWTPCSRTCFPGGKTSRTRRCVPPGAKCGKNQETSQQQVKDCNTQTCHSTGGGGWSFPF